MHQWLGLIPCKDEFNRSIIGPRRVGETVKPRFLRIRLSRERHLSVQRGLRLKEFDQLPRWRETPGDHRRRQERGCL